MWFDEAVVYQIYPLGLCGVLNEERSSDDSVVGHSILEVKDWISHIKKLGATCILFNPLMESDYHGYDTRDYYTVDRRLGTNDDLKEVCDAIHEAGLKILFDGVFNHVGRGFWAFKDVQEKKWDSPYCGWFHLSFDGNTEYNDGFWYEGWEGHNELVKLNLDNPDVRQHQFDAIKQWTDLYGIDGLRLDVAYCLSDFYLKELRRFTSTLKEDFVLMGETLHGDYNMYMNDEKCHSVTNYECYKGLYSSFNCANMHEISYSLNRQFGYENWCIYRGKHLMTFVDNHDVTRIASILTNKNHLPLCYGILFGMPGIPCIYYGSEWGEEGVKAPNNDYALRPCFEEPKPNELTEEIKKMIHVRTGSNALCHGSYRNVVLTNHQLIFERRTDDERMLVAINASDAPFTAHNGELGGTMTDLLTGNEIQMSGQLEMPPYSVQYLK